MIPNIGNLMYLYLGYFMLIFNVYFTYGKLNNCAFTLYAHYIQLIHDFVICRPISVGTMKHIIYHDASSWSHHLSSSTENTCIVSGLNETPCDNIHTLTSHTVHCIHKILLLQWSSHWMYIAIINYNKYTFVPWKHDKYIYICTMKKRQIYVCSDKYMFVATSICL